MHGKWLIATGRSRLCETSGAYSNRVVVKLANTGAKVAADPSFGDIFSIPTKPGAALRDVLWIPYWIAVGKLITDIASSLSDVSGSKSEHQELLRELESLHGQRHLDKLQLSGSSFANLT